jgi:hypothetical protein
MALGKDDVARAVSVLDAPLTPAQEAVCFHIVVEARHWGLNSNTITYEDFAKVRERVAARSGGRYIMFYEFKDWVRRAGKEA